MGGVLGGTAGRLATTSLIGAALLVAGGAGAAFGATYNVSTNEDTGGTCSPAPSTCGTLRQAISSVDAAPSPPDVINVPAVTITLGSALPITANMTIQGAGSGSGTATTIKASASASAVTIGGTATDVTLSQLNLTGGAGPGPGQGGAIHAEPTGSLTLNITGSVISSNAATSEGGAIYFEPAEEGSINISNTTFAANTAGSEGGAIRFEPLGGATSAMTIENSTFTGNTASENGEGGAIRFEPSGDGTLTIAGSTFANNAAIGGAFGGEGGAIRFEPGGPIGALTISGSTFSGNRVTNGGEGGAIRYFETGAESIFSVTNSTFTANAAEGSSGKGGAISFHGPSATLLNDTIAANTVGDSGAGGGAGIFGAAAFSAVNTIIAANTAGGLAIPDDCDAHVANSDHSLGFGSSSCGLDLSGNPILAALASNGGPTQTMMLGAGSAAIDAADSARCPSTDQRGVARPDDAGSACDVGALESGATTATTTTTTTIATTSMSVPPILRCAETRSPWRRGRKLASFSRRKRPPIGTTFSCTLDEPARLSLAFTQKVGGRRVKGKCVTHTRKNRHKPSCKLTATQATLSFAAHTGTNKVAFQGRISRSKKLRPGRYTVLISATNAAGQSSRPQSLGFMIVR